MHPLFFRSAAGALALAAMFSGGAAPNEAAARSHGASFVLTLHDSEAAESPVLWQAILRCDPDGGSHHRAGPACNALRSTQGRFEELPNTGEPCPLIYSPVVAEAHGTWHGQLIRFSKVYPNRCVAAAETGGVFF